MRLTVLGRSPARPNPGEACAGYLAQAGDTRVLFDIGTGVVARLLERHDPDELSAVVVSHMHADHMLDLVTMRYVYPWRRRPRDERLRVLMPPGSADQLLELARGVGSERHFEDAFSLSEHDGHGPIRLGSLTATPLATQHYIPCWGFRIEADGRVLAYSADSGPTAALRDIADTSDLFLCEATLRSLEEDAQPPAPRGHLLAAEAGEAARDAGARRLMLTHLPVDDGLRAAHAAAAAAFGAEVEIAQPHGTTEI